MKPHSPFDGPNSYIGRSVPRPNAKRLLAGRGQFTDDLNRPRLLHAAFLRSPYAHARIASIDSAAARTAPGVVLVADGVDLAKICQPWVGVLSHFPGLKSAPQYPLAVGKVVWRGEPLVAVVAASRAEAEDALDLLVVEYDELPAVTDDETALDPATPLIHPELGSNQAFALHLENGEVDRAFAEAAHIVETEMRFNRHTAVTLEPRSILAEFDPSERRLTVHQSCQTPYQMQDVYARHLGLAENDVRVVAGDVGGSFGMKLHVYGDEVATCALSMMLGRPVKFIADRMESFLSDIHARSHRVKARMAVSQEGRITGMSVDDLSGIGPFSAYPRTSAVEGNQAIRLMGGPYDFSAYRADLSVVFQNKAMMSQYRAVGHPIACAVTEALVDQAAHAVGLDVIEMRRRNVIRDDAYPCRSPTGYQFDALSHQQCLEKLVETMDYEGLRRSQAALRAEGIYRGIGIAAFIEITNPGPAFYGVGGARISSMDGCTIKLEPSGVIRCAVSVTEQGQGTEAVMGQVCAEALGVRLESVRVISGDTETTPFGGATWASRGAGIGGETVWLAARDLRANILALAATILQSDPAHLDLREGEIVDLADGKPRLSLFELARIGYFRPDTLPPDCQPQFTLSRHHVPRGLPFDFTNGLHASLVEVDIETGAVKILHHWVVEDCGTMLNPLLVDEQIRGGVVQGLGAALFEECVYDADGQLLNATLGDYLVPMAGEMPDITIRHVCTPARNSILGAKGVGEAGTAGSAAALLNAVNDALSLFGARITETPITPERVIRALGKL